MNAIILAESRQTHKQSLLGSKISMLVIVIVVALILLVLPDSNKSNEIATDTNVTVEATSENEFSDIFCIPTAQHGCALLDSRCICTDSRDSCNNVTGNHALVDCTNLKGGKFIIVSTN